MEALQKLGADEVVLITDTSVFQPVDVVFETVGEQTWDQSIAMLKPFGRLVLAGTTSGKRAALDLQTFYGKQLSLLGARMGSSEEFEEVLSLVEKGILRPVVNRLFPLSEAASAHQALEGGEGVGKIVLEVL